VGAPSVDKPCAKPVREGPQARLAVGRVCRCEGASRYGGTPLPLGRKGRSRLATSGRLRGRHQASSSKVDPAQVSSPTAITAVTMQVAYGSHWRPASSPVDAPDLLALSVVQVAGNQIHQIDFEGPYRLSRSRGYGPDGRAGW
jgi:hypothetical protein